MSESERAEAIKAVQMELFALHERRKELKRKMAQLALAGTKWCRKCRETMGVEQFYADKRYADGLHPYCRECKADYYRSRRAA